MNSTAGNSQKRDKFRVSLPFGRSRKSSRAPQSQDTPHTTAADPRTSTPPTTSGAQVSKSQDDNISLKLAIQEYCSQIAESDRTVFENASRDIKLDELFAKIRTYDKEHQQRSNFRPHTEKLTKALEILQRFMSGVSIAIQANPTPAAIVVGAAQLAITSAMEIATFFDRLTDMADRLSDFFDPLITYSRSAKRSELINRELANVYKDLLEFWTAAYRVFMAESGKRRRLVSLRTYMRVQWDPFENIFGKIEERFKHHLNVLVHGSGASLLHFLSEAEDARKAKEREEFLRWLSEDNFETAHEERYTKKHPRTGEWLIHTDKFQKWKDCNSSALLWCHGKAGAGKSILLSNVLEHITEQYGAREEIGISFIYYDFKQPDLGDPSRVVSALIKQLCRRTQNTMIAPLRKCKHDALSPTFEILRSQFTSLASSFDETFIIIDALDECPSERRDRIIEFLTTVLSTLPRTKIFVTSRRESDISEAFESTNVPTIKIEAENVIEDIRSYVSSEVKKLRKGYNGKKLYLKNDVLESKIIMTLTERSEGMFLWVQLQLESLRMASRSRNDDDIVAALENSPQGIEEMYRRIVRQIEEQPENLKNIALRVLMWVLYSKGILLKEQLVEMLRVHRLIRLEGDDHESYDLQSVFDTCANLIELQDLEIYPIHYSVQETFTNPRSSIFESSTLKILIQPQIVHHEIAEFCLNYLNNQIDHTVREYSEEGFFFYVKCRDHPLLWYSSRNFDYHISMLQQISSDQKIQLECLLTKPSVELRGILQVRLLPTANSSTKGFRKINYEVDAGTIVHCTELCNRPDLDHLISKYKPPRNQLHLASGFALMDQIERLLKVNYPVDDLDSDGMPPIYHASYYGHVHVVDRLLRAGANPNIQLTYYGSILQAAANFGHEQIVRRLLYNRSGESLEDNPSTQDELNRDGDKSARRSSHSSVDVNILGGYYGTALQAASFFGRKNIVKMLLDAGADINIQGGEYCTALQAASCAGRETTVRMLLEAGADVNIQGGSCGTALQGACTSADKTLVRMLLDAGADVNKQGGYYGTALQVASIYSDEAMARMLLDAGADANIQSGQYGTALQAASSIDDSTVARILLEAGADVNIRGGEYGSALKAARAHGNAEMEKLLIEAGAQEDEESQGESQEESEEWFEEEVKLERRR